MFCIELSYLHIIVVLLLIIILFTSEFLYSVLRVKLCLFIFHTLFRWALGSKKHGNFKELRRSYSLNSWLKNKTSKINNLKKKKHKKLLWYSWLLILLFILKINGKITPFQSIHFTVVQFLGLEISLLNWDGICLILIPKHGCLLSWKKQELIFL